MKTQSRIEYWFPGSLMSESSSYDIDHRDPHKVEVPKGAFAFQFFDLQTLTGTLEDGSPIEKSTEINWRHLLQQLHVFCRG